MKVQLVVVRGKPEGKVIPLVGPTFKIGRGETCHLRPSSEQVSREHAEFTISAGTLVVRDLGSRNGTLVNGKALTAEPCTLKDRDLVQVGPLTFAVSMVDTPAVPAKQAVPAAPAAKASPEEVSNEDIDSWLIGENAAAVSEQPTAVYGGDTLTISAFKDASKQAGKEVGAAAKPPASDTDDEYVRQPEDELDAGEPFADEEAEEEENAEEYPVAEEMPEEMIDETNPFYLAKKALQQGQQAGPSKPAFENSSEAASDILRRLMERRKASKSS